MKDKIRALLIGAGSLLDLDGRATRERMAETSRHPFFDTCEHGTQFLDECEQCPNGWQPRSEWGDE